MAVDADQCQIRFEEAVDQGHVTEHVSVTRVVDPESIFKFDDIANRGTAGNVSPLGGFGFDELVSVKTPPGNQLPTMRAARASLVLRNPWLR